MKLIWSLRARTDLLEIGAFIARDSPRLARAHVAKLTGRMRKAARFPRSGRVVPEFGDESLREVVLLNYRIVYEVADRTITVLTVFEAHRRLPPGLSSRGA